MELIKISIKENNEVIKLIIIASVKHIDIPILKKNLIK